MTWTFLPGFDPVAMTLRGVRERSDGPRGELVVVRGGREIHWGLLSLASTQARETLVRKLNAVDEEPSWRPMLERMCRETARAARQGEPLITLRGRVVAPPPELMRGLLYEGQSTAIHADGDTGKSLFATAIATAMDSGAPLPCGLRPMRSVLSAYLDWETTEEVVDGRVALVAAGLGITAPQILYKRMTRPLV